MKLNIKNLIILFIVLSIACVSVDEFNFKIIFFTLKVSLLFFFLAFFLFLFQSIMKKTMQRINNIFIFLFLGILVIGVVLHYTGISQVWLPTNSNNFISSSLVITKTFNLTILLIWLYLLVTYLTYEKLFAGVYCLTILMLFKELYIIKLLIEKSYSLLWWLPNGLPRFALNFGGMTANQTGAIWLVISIFWGIAIFNFNKNNLIYKAFLLLSIVMGFLSWSRSFALGVLLFLSFLFFRKITIKRFLMAIIVTFFVVFAYLYFAPGHIIDDSSRERITKWSASINNIILNPLFGSGFGTDLAPHNVCIQLLSETGIIGFFCAFISIGYCFLRSLIVYKVMYLPIMIFLPYLVFLCTDIGLLQWQTWLLISMIIIIPRDYSKYNKAHSNAISKNSCNL